ncbi:MAG: QueT transporter family protein [Clostridia bacterium]|nr:QueT transporter family protein [Clostridia bacterium]
MLNKKPTSKQVANAGIISAIYIALSLIFYPISYGGVQVRISEALSLLPLFFPESVLGLTVGCLISNLFGNGLLDVVFGTLATLLSATLTYFIGTKIKSEPLKITVGGIFPVVINAVIVPFTFLAVTELKSLYLINAVQVFLGQAISVYALGIPIYLAIKKSKKN